MEPNKDTSSNKSHINKTKIFSMWEKAFTGYVTCHSNLEVGNYAWLESLFYYEMKQGNVYPTQLEYWNEWVK